MYSRNDLHSIIVKSFWKLSSHVTSDKIVSFFYFQNYQNVFFCDYLQTLHKLISIWKCNKFFFLWIYCLQYNLKEEKKSFIHFVKLIVLYNIIYDQTFSQTFKASWFGYIDSGIKYYQSVIVLFFGLEETHWWIHYHVEAYIWR